MPEPSALSVAFIESHPERAAQVLGSLPVAESAAFLAAAPARLSAALVRHMTPQHAARCAEEMDEGTLSALIAVMGPQAAAALLRHLAPDRQARVLEKLPAATAVTVRLLVGYARDTAGSCMDPLPLALPEQTSAEDALAAFRKHDGGPGDGVFAVTAGRRLRGVISAADLLRAPPQSALSTLGRRSAPCVSVLTPLTAVRGHPGWLEVSSLAVIEGEDRLVGALRLAAVEAALAQHADVSDQGSSNAVAGLGSVCWETLESLAQLAVNLAPPIGAVARGKEHHDGR